MLAKSGIEIKDKVIYLQKAKENIKKLYKIQKEATKNLLGMPKYTILNCLKWTSCYQKLINWERPKWYMYKKL